MHAIPEAVSPKPYFDLLPNLRGARKGHTSLCGNLSQTGFEDLLPELIIKLKSLHLDEKEDFLENFSDLNSTRLIVKRRVKFRLSTVFTLL